MLQIFYVHIQRRVESWRFEVNFSGEYIKTEDRDRRVFCEVQEFAQSAWCVTRISPVCLRSTLKINVIYAKHIVPAAFALWLFKA
jgi:hypothetical protein